MKFSGRLRNFLRQPGTTGALHVVLWCSLLAGVHFESSLLTSLLAIGTLVAVYSLFASVILCVLLAIIFFGLQNDWHNSTPHRVTALHWLILFSGAAFLQILCVLKLFSWGVAD